MNEPDETDFALAELPASHAQVFLRAALVSRRRGRRIPVWTNHKNLLESAFPDEPGLHSLEISPFQGSGEQAYVWAFPREPSGKYDFFFELNPATSGLECAIVLSEMASLARIRFWQCCCQALSELLQTQRKLLSKRLHRGMAQEITIAQLEIGLSQSVQTAERIVQALKRCSDELRDLHDTLLSPPAPEPMKQRLHEELTFLANLSGSRAGASSGGIILAQELVSETLVFVWTEIDGTIVERNEDSYEFSW